MSAGVAEPNVELEVRGLTKYFSTGTALFSRERVHAVDDVSFTLRSGRVTALVGESGSGKSTVARLLLRLYEPTAGSVIFDGRDISTERSREDILRYRSNVQMIFQDPFGSLNPVKTVHHHLARPLQIHGVVPSGELEGRIHALLDTVGLVPPAAVAAKYPHELSGGQRQRVAIARALAVRPTVLIADEPTSMLDVSIRIGILNLIIALKEDHRLAFLYVTHDLASARYVADDVLVMYAGQVVEQGPIDQVLQTPLHPYTRLLLSAAPDPTGAAPGRVELNRAQQSAAVDPHAGCRFRERCPLVIDVCARVTPELVDDRQGQSARCHVTAPSTAIREETPHVGSTR